MISSIKDIYRFLLECQTTRKRRWKNFEVAWYLMAEI